MKNSELQALLVQLPPDAEVLIHNRSESDPAWLKVDSAVGPNDQPGRPEAMRSVVYLDGDVECHTLYVSDEDMGELYDDPDETEDGGFAEAHELLDNLKKEDTK